MIEIGLTAPSPESSVAPSLADLSRNASVISTSSSDSGPSLRLSTPPRPRPIRTFTSPRNRSPNPTSPQTPRHPSYLSSELGLSAPTPSVRARSRARSESRSRAVGVSVHDFTFGRTLGEGSYSTVKHVTHIATKKEYAIKVLEKNHLIRHHKVQTANAEKNALVRLGTGHPGIVRLYWAFHDEARLYFVIDLATNGEMQSRLVKMGSFSTLCAQYYTAQIIDAVEYMHSKGVIHRDLKPENVLLDSDFRIKLTDFGTGKIIEPGSAERPKTFVGTAQYVSPELLEANETSKSSDLWALGCIVYQMIAGRFAFQGLSEYLTWQKIKQLDYSFPDGFDTDAKDLVQKLLVRDPEQRLGAGSPGSQNDMQVLRSHSFLSSVKWETLWSDPAPPLESGLVKREHPLASGNDQNWDDVGATWDDLVESDGEEEESDEIAWASYDELTRVVANSQSHNGHVEDVGPMGERRPALHTTDSGKKVCFDESDNVIIPSISPDVSNEPNGSGPVLSLDSLQIDHKQPPATGPSDLTASMPRPISAKKARADPDAVGSGTSSSEGSPVERLGAVLDAMMTPFRSPGSRRSSPDKTAFRAQEAQAECEERQDRGRTRTQTPIQGQAYITSLLSNGECIKHTGTVEARSIRRRASRLLPLNVSPAKPKTRQLVLTNQRLICLKQQSKYNGEPSLKMELLLKTTEREVEKSKDKEARAIVTQVEAKGEREFVVLTLTKSFSFAAPDSSSASAWLQCINAALESISSSSNRT